MGTAWANIYKGSDDIVSELIEVPSYDGTLVPMSIMRNKNTKLDGNNVCILYGYGAYGTLVREIISMNTSLLIICWFSVVLCWFMHMYVAVAKKEKHGTWPV
ncbi:MAG: hypothetical protein IPH33_14405 [Bacteroidetes bacterium]|nr:hypothetical protein [Bacteroidota bacterium]